MLQPSQPTRVDALAVLGLAGTATAEQITAAYRRLAKATHPDATGRTDPAAADRFTQITRAYHRLMPHAGASAPTRSPVDEQPPAHVDRAARLGYPASASAPPSPPPSPPSPWPDPPLVAGPAIVTPSSHEPGAGAGRSI